MDRMGEASAKVIHTIIQLIFNFIGIRVSNRDHFLAKDVCQRPHFILQGRGQQMYWLLKSRLQKTVCQNSWQFPSRDAATLCPRFLR